MNKALMLLSAALFLGSALFAQPRVIGTHPAHTDSFYPEQ